MTPKITIVIPVYNVEKYLAECLDSVIGQTMRDVQIICVNDGSPDRSPEILKEYASRDSRIEIIHKKNGGLSSARNAAYPFSRGKYTLFVDSDDSIDPALCEKTWTIAEKEQADMTFFLYHSARSTGQHPPLQKFLRNKDFSQIDEATLLREMMAWCKLWRTSFLLENKILFPEGLCFEDNVAHWKAMQCHPKVACVPEKLLHYRVTPTSITSDTNSPRYLDLVRCYDLIKKDMIELGNYHGARKRLFLKTKLQGMVSRYNIVSRKVKVAMLKKIRESYGDEEKEFIRETNDCPWHIVDFYHAIEGSRIAWYKCAIISLAKRVKYSFQYYVSLLRENTVRAGK